MYDDCYKLVFNLVSMEYLEKARIKVQLHAQFYHRLIIMLVKYLYYSKYLDFSAHYHIVAQRWNAAVLTTPFSKYWFTNPKYQLNLDFSA